MTGQNSFVKAVGVQEDYAAGLEKTSKNTNQAAKNTKKANKETEGYLSTLMRSNGIHQIKMMICSRWKIA